MKTLYYFLLFAICAACLISCSRPKYVSDYDYRKAEEAYVNEDYDEAFSLVNRQLRATPKHVDALFLLSHVHYQRDENEAALSDLARAIRYYRGDSKVVLSSLYAGRGIILSELERYAEAAKAFDRAEKCARKDNPDYVQEIRFQLAQAYYKLGNREAAERVYEKMLQDDSEDMGAMVGIARNRLGEERYEAALEWLYKAQALDEDYSSVYKFKMLVLDKMGDREGCIEAALKFVELDEDAPMNPIADYCGKYYSYAVAKVKSRIHYADDPVRWQVLLTSLYEGHGDYGSAVAVYNDLLEEYDYDDCLYCYRGQCYEKLGEYEKAVSDLTRAFKLNELSEYLHMRGDAYCNNGDYDEAIDDYLKCNDYYEAGRCCEFAGWRERALYYYDYGVNLYKTDARIFVRRAHLLSVAGETKKAQADYERVLELDTIPEDGSCRHYALLGLGREDEAEEWMNQVIARDTMNAGNFYDRACLYGRMGRLDASLAALDTAFQKGFRRFAHLEHDDDIDPIRNLPLYKELVEHYRFATTHTLIEADPAPVIPEAQKPTSISEIPMRKRPGGTYEVSCAINGLPLRFVFDTGASDVTLSSVEADFMLKNDFLSERDFRGSRRYLTASGNVCGGAQVCLKEIRVGDITLKNVEASVVKNQKAPLLLGQSALERFGTITIDNQASKLIIKH